MVSINQLISIVHLTMPVKILVGYTKYNTNNEILLQVNDVQVLLHLLIAISLILGFDQIGR